MEDDELQERVEDVLDDDAEEDTGRHAADDESTEDSEVDGEEDDDTESDDTEEDDEEGKKPQRRTQTGKSGNGGNRAQRDERTDDEDDDDDDGLAYKQPDFSMGQFQAQQFDINKAPRDPVTGLIDPNATNAALAEFNQKQMEAQRAHAQRSEQNRRLLINQWEQVKTKLPEVYGQRQFREMARDLHLNSIGSDNYLTPWQAAQRVAKALKKAQASGYKSAKSRKTVERMARTERSGGKSTNTGKVSPYEKAKKQALSRDPKVAAEGRRAIIRLRREARSRS